MFGISSWELALIALVALIFLGPRQLAETAKVLGRVYREIQRLALDARSSIDLDTLTSPPPDRHERQKIKQEVTQAITPIPDLVQQPGERTGPDFYADLLEQSKEEEAPEETAAEGPSGSEGGLSKEQREKPAADDEVGDALKTEMTGKTG